MDRWDKIKEEYSQSGLFDQASDLEKELDLDVTQLLEEAYEEGQANGSCENCEGCQYCSEH